MPYLDHFKASSHSVTFGKRSCRPHETAAGAPAAPAPPGEAACACRPNQAPAATERGTGQGEVVEGREERPRRSCADRGLAGNRHPSKARCQPARHRCGHSSCAGWQRAHQTLQAQEGFSVSCSTHTGAGVPVTAAEDRLRLCRRDGWSVHTYALPAPRCWPGKRDGLTRPWRNGSRAQTAQTMAFRARRLMNLTATAGLISPDLQKYLKEAGSAETYQRQGTAGLNPPPLSIGPGAG